MIFLNNKGFTLIEVLISALILFTVLSLGTFAYRSSIGIVDRFIATAGLSDALPGIIAVVKQDLLAHKMEGSGRQGKDIQYKWFAKEMKSSKNIISSYDEATGGLEYGHFRLKLNEIHLTVSYHGAGIDRKKQYEYNELSWVR